jgi:hypothetical protein
MTKKTPNKKTAKSKKTTTAKKQVTKKAAAKKPPVIKAANVNTRRPAVTPAVPPLKAGKIAEDLNAIKTTLEDYAAHLRALDRKRLNGVGIKKQGFIQRALEFAIENPEFLPHYLTLQKFHKDDEYFQSFRMMCDTSQQIHELLWNITIEASDMVYTDGLEYYASVREAAKRRVDAAETIHAGLSVFFKSHGRRPEEDPTQKQEKRDFNSLLHGKKDGRLVIENITPKITAGKRKVIDQTFRDNIQFQDTEEADFKE